VNEAEFSIMVEGASILVKLRGEIDLETSPQLVACLDVLRSSAIVDCSGLDFIDSSGIRAFMQAHKDFRARGDRLTLRNLPPLVQRVFDVAGVLAIFDVE
jgi:anti-anti-sigma factor